MVFSRYNSSHSTAPSAPELPPESYHQPPQQQHYQSYYGQPQAPVSSPSSSYGQRGGFPAGTPPDVVRAFQMVDKDRGGFIDEHELQQALSSGYQRFNLRTIRLLMFLFKNPYDALRIGPAEFAALWSCLGHWRGCFKIEKF
ncbi:probable calcium-binding protein CML48 [Hibiscus syriacus]|uniref:probable calcium-binding protein CML48 n=1 Tax=Hibiscus syriacus TaxID=106335 RepID=UPI0019205254|nr:probable calcium-binding protein CML48 [Hibiscus syriacus]